MPSCRFRWASCQLESVRRCLPQSVRHVLADLPETLDETYDRILREIPKVNQEHAHRLLQCLTVAVRPLRVQELAEVLAVDFSEPGGVPTLLNEDWRWEDQEQAVLSACSSLITVAGVQNSRIVQFLGQRVPNFRSPCHLKDRSLSLSSHLPRTCACHHGTSLYQRPSLRQAPHRRREHQEVSSSSICSHPPRRSR